LKTKAYERIDVGVNYQFAIVTGDMGVEQIIKETAALGTSFARDRLRVGAPNHMLT